jgi:hypothetical protein
MAKQKPKADVLAPLRQKFGVPARRVVQVRFRGRPGRIPGVSGDMVRIRFDGQSVGVPCHPLDLDYLPEDRQPLRDHRCEPREGHAR